MTRITKPIEISNKTSHKNLRNADKNFIICSVVTVVKTSLEHIRVLRKRKLARHKA